MSITAPQAIGYKEVVAALDGQTTMDEARERIKQATRRYAKRQRTWFRKDARASRGWTRTGRTHASWPTRPAPCWRHVSSRRIRSIRACDMIAKARRGLAFAAL